MTIFDRTEKSESGKASVASTSFQAKAFQFHFYPRSLAPGSAEGLDSLSGYIKNNNNIVMWGIM